MSDGPKNVEQACYDDWAQKRIAELEAELAAKEYSIKLNKLDNETLNLALNRASQLERELAHVRDETHRWSDSDKQRVLDYDKLDRQRNQLLAQNARLTSLSLSLLNWCHCTNPCAVELRQALSETPAASVTALFGPTVELLKKIADYLSLDASLNDRQEIQQELARIESLRL